MTEILDAKRRANALEQAKVLAKMPATKMSNEGVLYLAQSVLLLDAELAKKERALERAEARAEGKKGRARVAMGDVINEVLTRERVEEIVDAALEATVNIRAFCPRCKTQVNAPAPDVKKQIDVVAALLEQAEGKPGGEAGGTTIVVERPALRQVAPVGS